jgi:hypothetical protein
MRRPSPTILPTPFPLPAFPIGFFTPLCCRRQEPTVARRRPSLVGRMPSRPGGPPPAPPPCPFAVPPAPPRGRACTPFQISSAPAPREVSARLRPGKPRSFAVAPPSQPARAPAARVQHPSRGGCAAITAGGGWWRSGGPQRGRARSCGGKTGVSGGSRGGGGGGGGGARRGARGARGSTRQSRHKKARKQGCTRGGRRRRVTTNGQRAWRSGRRVLGAGVARRGKGGARGAPARVRGPGCALPAAAALWPRQRRGARAGPVHARRATRGSAARAQQRTARGPHRAEPPRVRRLGRRAARRPRRRGGPAAPTLTGPSSASA